MTYADGLMAAWSVRSMVLYLQAELRSAFVAGMQGGSEMHATRGARLRGFVKLLFNLPQPKE
jgi:hypothetical protein